jgi:F-type H+-transporting ATPase subunit delta
MRRSYAEAVPRDKLIVTVASPYQTFMKEEVAEQVNLSTSAGDIGILHKHVPTIQQLRPGMVEVLGSPSGPNGNPVKLFGASSAILLYL